MEPLQITKSTSISVNQEASLSKEENESKENQELTLPNQVDQLDLSTKVLYQGYYFYSWLLPHIMAFQQHFQPQDTDIILATKPKSGTTWLKSLIYSIVHRNDFTNSNHPLLTKNPHELIRNFEFYIYSLERTKEEQNDLLASRTSTRIFSTHLPYDVLTESIKGQSNKCKIVYMARNPFDTVVSFWKFETQIVGGVLKNTSCEGFVESFCKGEELFGPHWNHVLGYWKESLEKPNKLLFLKYEDMQEDGISEIKKLAEFLGYGFSDEEERQGVIQEILRLCSIENLKNLEVNKTGCFDPHLKNSSFFRKGEVGDWVNHLNPTMVQRLDQVMRKKFAGSGLEYKMYPKI